MAVQRPGVVEQRIDLVLVGEGGDGRRTRTPRLILARAQAEPAQRRALVVASHHLRGKWAWLLFVNVKSVILSSKCRSSEHEHRLPTNIII